MIEAVNISKRFSRDVEAVKGANLTISEGMRVYIHGPSGAGKSTLMHILGALSLPTSGQVKFHGQDLYAFSDKKRSMIRNKSFGFIFQFYHLLPELNVLENVTLPARIKGGEKSKSLKTRAMSLLETVGIEKRAKHRPNQLSGGEAQRTAVARALINSPEVLFCDEPTGNLDSERSREIYTLLYEVSKKNKMSVVVVSHDEVDKKFFHTDYMMIDGALKRAESMGKAWKTKEEILEAATGGE